MKVFDANLLLGRLAWRPIGVDSPAEMLRTMDRFGIERGLVSHLTACIHDAEIGNRLLFDAVSGHEDRLLPVPVVDLNDGGRWQGRVAEWRDRRVRALKLAPAFYRNSLSGPEAAALAETASEQGWPVVTAIQTVRGIPWASGRPGQALELAQRFPELKVLALGAGRNSWYEMVPAMQAAENLYMDLSNLETGMALEQLTAAGLEDRLLCGSNYGASYANVCLERVKCSGVGDAVKGKVLERNAFAFLGETQAQ